MFKRALVSTSNKNGLVDFLKPLVAQGCEIVSTGGTSQFLRENGLRVTEVAEVTGFPEMMDGRVRTLHPKIHMGLLARSFVPEDFELLKEHGVKPFDLVVVNLYPFAEAVKKGLTGQDLIEQIDIGGPSLLRAAAKSFERISVVCDPQDYSEVAERAQTSRLDKKFNLSLAAKVFAHCSHYDSLIAKTLAEKSTDNDTPQIYALDLEKQRPLRYGENPHQKAAYYSGGLSHPLSLHQAQQKQGKELSYNNLLDLEAAISVVSEFDGPACAIIKHNIPCGVAQGQSIGEAFTKAFEGDPVSAFGGIVALNKSVDAPLAQKMIQPFLECIVAPEFDSEALKILQEKKNLRILVLPALQKAFSLLKESSSDFEFRSMRGGALLQTHDAPMSWDETRWKVLGGPLTSALKENLLMAQKVVKHVKSNAIVIVSGLQTIGICGGQTNRVDSVKMALERAQKNAGARKNWVLGSDAFFPFRDSVDLAAKSGVEWIIQPGGSMRDQEVELAAQEHKIGMVLTGVRHFKH